MTEPLYAGVELGGTKCVCILAAGPDRVVATERIATGAPGATLGRIVEVLREWDVATRARALGVGSFGPLELDPDAPDYGHVVRTPKPGWSGVDIVGPLVAATGLPVMLDTDVAGAALAEGRWGAARGLASHAYVTVGTGIGVGIVVNGQTVRGLGHPEAGHLRIPRMAGDDWPGHCPYHGDCVEGLAAGPAIAARSGRAAELLSPDDPAWDGVVHALAMMLHNLVLTTAPQRILLGGGVPVGQPHLIPRIRAALVASLGGYAHAERVAEDIQRFVSGPELGAMAGPMGAIALARLAIADVAA
ncbi:ROK family protein [Sphingomonas prati]|uniref:fructokinase n=1 Tax=Sphingomonas prati TaxID=1843237 RepID=A0A7W9BSJ3_9SPHN|nr:ROK family protein [Sphingomonas prati]MBB5729129.1 fructokinase [Sphingomonas prati]GGE84865.1 fructokinase [Sphingomonas prati]